MQAARDGTKPEQASLFRWSRCERSYLNSETPIEAFHKMEQVQKHAKLINESLISRKENMQQHLPAASASLRQAPPPQKARSAARAAK